MLVSQSKCAFPHRSSLHRRSAEALSSACSKPIPPIRHTFPPKTSSPIIRQAAVCKVLVLRSSAADDVMMRDVNVPAADVCP